MNTKKKSYDLYGRNHYPGIIGPFDWEEGGNKLNWLRWFIMKLIALNNYIEKGKVNEYT